MSSCSWPAMPAPVARSDRARRALDVAVGDRRRPRTRHGISVTLREPLRPVAVTSRSMAPQFILTMRDLRRVHPPDKEVLRGINISMYPGAKIGVLGLNGSGKSTLLRIIAGEDDGYSGECRVTPGFSVGFLPQEPHLDPSKDVLGNVTDGVAHTKGLLDRFEEVCNAMGEPDADFDKLLAEQAELQDQIDAVNGWDLDRQLDIAMDALRLPPSDADVTTLSGGERRRVALCRLLLVEARPAAARRADEPPRRRVGRVARTPPAGVPRHRRRGDPRPLLPRQRRGLDPRARPRARHPVGRQLLELARAEGRAARAGREGRRDAPAHARARARVDPHGAARAAGQGQGAHHRVRTAGRRSRSRPKAPGQAADLDPARAAPRRARRRGRAAHKGYGDRLLVEDFVVLAAARRHRRRRSAPNGAGKTTLFRMLVGQEQPDAGTLQGRPDRRVRVRRPVARVARRDQDRLRGDHRRRRPPQGRRPRGPRPRVRRRASTSRAPTSRSRSATSRAASATGSISPRRC